MSSCSIERDSRDSRATIGTSSISAPARSIVAGAQYSPGMPSTSVTISDSGRSSTSALYTDSRPT